MVKKSIFESDPGARNDLPLDEGLFSAEKYLKRQAQHVSAIDQDTIKQFAIVLDQVTKNNGQVFFSGNGGSFGIALHMVCDYAKGMRRVREGGFRAICLGSNGCLHTALVNDFGRDNALAAELEIYAKKGDALVAISSSGNSENILNAVRFSKENSILTLGLDGFGGGALSKEADYSFTTSAMTYPEVEACHQIFLDSVAFTLWE